MYFTTATAISLLSITLSASATPLHTRNIDTGFWQLSIKPRGDSSAIAVPIILGFGPDNNWTQVSTGAEGEVPLCIQLLRTVDSEGVPAKGAKVINHPSIAEDLYMWKTQGAKYLMTSTRINIGSGIRGNWTFVQDPNSSDMILDLDGDTVAKLDQWGMHFGSDTPPTVVGPLVTVVGVPVEAC